MENRYWWDRNEGVKWMTRADAEALAETYDNDPTALAAFKRAIKEGKIKIKNDPSLDPGVPSIHKKPPKKTKNLDLRPKPVAKVKPVDMPPQFVFVDLETTGLDHIEDAILEIAIMVTDVDLGVLDCRSWIVSMAAAPPLDMWAPQARQMHEKNGLIKDCQERGLMVGEVETEALEFLTKFSDPGKMAMCGSSVHFDRRMLMHGMPAVEAWFHYRNLDVSSFKVLVNIWAKEKNAPYIKPEDKAHRGLADIDATIEELRHYRRVFGLEDPLPYRDDWEAPF